MTANTVDKTRIVVNGVMWEIPTPVAEEIERLTAVKDAAVNLTYVSGPVDMGDEWVMVRLSKLIEIDALAAVDKGES